MNQDGVLEEQKNRGSVCQRKSVGSGKILTFLKVIQSLQLIQIFNLHEEWNIAQKNIQTRISISQTDTLACGRNVVLSSPFICVVFTVVLTEVH